MWSVYLCVGEATETADSVGKHCPLRVYCINCMKQAAWLSAVTGRAPLTPTAHIRSLIAYNTDPLTRDINTSHRKGINEERLQEKAKYGV